MVGIAMKWMSWAVSFILFRDLHGGLYRMVEHWQSTAFASSCKGKEIPTRSCKGTGVRESLL